MTQRALIRAQRCETCVNWTQYHGEGFCGSLYQPRQASSGCEGWLPIFRRLGELRKPMDSYRRQWLRLSAVRRLFARKKISYQQIIPLATRGMKPRQKKIVVGAISVWAELEPYRKSASA